MSDKIWVCHFLTLFIHQNPNITSAINNNITTAAPPVAVMAVN
jgi:hypothetical protein